MRIVIEKKMHKEFMFEKEVQTTRELADTVKGSPAKMNILVKNAPMNTWEYISGTDFRFRKVGE